LGSSIISKEIYFSFRPYQNTIKCYHWWPLWKRFKLYIWYIGRVTSMKAIQAPVILIIKRIIQSFFLKILFNY
jgi:hypothetical protein